MFLFIPAAAALVPMVSQTLPEELAPLRTHVQQLVTPEHPKSEPQRPLIVVASTAGETVAEFALPDTVQLPAQGTQSSWSEVLLADLAGLPLTVEQEQLVDSSLRSLPLAMRLGFVWAAEFAPGRVACPVLVSGAADTTELWQSGRALAQGWRTQHAFEPDVIVMGEGSAGLHEKGPSYRVEGAAQRSEALWPLLTGATPALADDPRWLSADQRLQDAATGVASWVWANGFAVGLNWAAFVARDWVSQTDLGVWFASGCWQAGSA